MTEDLIRDILNASDAIDDALSIMTKENRGKTSRAILKNIRDLNDAIALGIWQDLYPSKPMGINKAAQQFFTDRAYKVIGRFDNFIQKALSHFTPSEDGAERLLIKYYRYLIELKRIMKTKYNVEILKNIDFFLEDIDEQTKDYYTKVAKQIDKNPQTSSDYDIYYIDRIKPFYINQSVYFEVTLEPAEEKVNKFNRITAFTKCDINTPYAVALQFIEKTINVFDVNFPIKIITDWQVSIRPCEIENFARILNHKITIQRGLNEYKTLMQLLKTEELTLVELIDLNNKEYNKFKSIVVDNTKEKKSRIFNILDECRNICINKEKGMNILRYLLSNMLNRNIKLQWPYDMTKTYADYYLASKCYPFDKNPFAFHPYKHTTKFYHLLNCIDPTGRESELIARYASDNTYENGILYTPITDLSSLGDEETITANIMEFNNQLYSGHRPYSEVGIYKNHIFNQGYELEIVEIINSIKQLTNEEYLYSDCFCKDNIKQLYNLPDKEKLDDEAKEIILNKIGKQSRVHLIYGAAGTGKSTLINHISNILTNKRRIFLAKTNPAVENLRHKVIHHEKKDEFITIDKFTRNSFYDYQEYDLIVVDECSTVTNEEMLKILNMTGSALLILAGDTYQIEAIGYGTWFKIIKDMLSPDNVHELYQPFRSTDVKLKELWKEVRNMSDDNLVLEDMVRSDYSHPIDKDIFKQRCKDEIILCLNYNGLYGLNNINKLIQLGNPNKPVEIGIWQFKINDPILFNDSERFEVLYNNLKGKILNIVDNVNSVEFTVLVEIELSQEDINRCEGLAYIQSSENETIVKFSVNRRPPYFYDMEQQGKDHIMPFQVAYAVSIHKSQGLEYDSVKIVIADDSENKITHDILYTAITRARQKLMIYWSPEVCNRILAKIRPQNNNKDIMLLKSKYTL